MERLRQYNLKLDPKKCVFAASSVRHLGFLISADGIKPDPDKLEPLKTWPRPRTVRDVKSFVGYAGYFRRLIEKFAHKAKPLNDLTVGYVARGSKAKKGVKGRLTLDSDISHLWTDRHQTAFEQLIEDLTSEPVVALADKEKPFQLHVDASGFGLGAALYQKHDGLKRVVAYASRGLNKSEANYPAHKREFLGLKWAMTEKFHDYLYGSKCTVFTDNNPLCYVLKNAKLDATSHRWLAALSLYDFDLRYKKGSKHIDADTLSRAYRGTLEEDEEFKKTQEAMKFITDKA